MAKPTLVPSSTSDVSKRTSVDLAVEDAAISAQFQGSSTPSMAKDKPIGLSDFRKFKDPKGISVEAQELIKCSWRDATQAKYGTPLRRWVEFCRRRSIDPFKPSLKDGINFLANLFKKGQSYSCINTARSALSTLVSFIDSRCFGQEESVKRLMKGIFNRRPSLPRYTVTWDIKVVLDYLETLSTVEINLKFLTLKVTMLLALVTAQRVQTLKALVVKNLIKYDDRYVFTIDSLLKQTRPGFHVSHVTIPKFTKNLELCPCQCIDRYLVLTKDLRSDDLQLLISFQKPHHAITTDTIARWIRTVLNNAGIDICRFKAHSTRSASTSAAGSSFLPINDILEAGGWSNAKTFGLFYNKPVEQKSFGATVLSREDED